MTQDNKTDWPLLPYADWAETCTALHLWAQIVGKYRLAHAPWMNHSWHATLYVTPRRVAGNGCSARRRDGRLLKFRFSGA
ncbi:DUF5996 family protein [Mesorhizobium escarrei]|uniref:Uncharacterized protein n=1 Tax=Mesorhizobium escarrei TaxID=666018 RepID=A0ABN8JPB3_9HYPH|nr:DUF5996 family protein [Mesorhizobium escarrei]CAH2398501.1 hypothetical protein MES5069_200040 [Mesorhizobium escarrei]